MDKLVGKLLAELDRLKLRDNTLILFAGDNGTASPYYLRSTVHGKALSGHKGTMEECGALVPCIASWPGTVPSGKESRSLFNLCDFFPTLAEIAGAQLPAGVTIDGKDFAPQLFGQSEVWPRDWIFVELGRHWYDRDAGWKLNEASKLFDMRNAPYAEPLIATNTQDEVAIAARKRLQAILDQLNPAGGIVDTGDGSGRHASNPKRDAKKAARKKARQASGNNASENANASDE